MIEDLSQVEARVLGTLIEKQVTTPEYYPLSLNALVNACNQKSNRDPVMALDESAVRSALRTLAEKALVQSAVAIDSRVAKYEHQIQEAFNFTRPEIAILCELLLRGPQTPGELRSHASRLYPFADLSVIHSGLQKLIERDPPLAKLLERQPGTKEARYAHLLSGDPAAQTAAPSLATAAAQGPLKSSADARIAAVEQELAALQNELSEMKRELAAFRKQFE